jgi:MFS family permease
VRAVLDLRHLLRGRDFRRLFAVRLCSQFADGVFQVAVASYVLFSPERQATPLAIAGALASVLLPFSLLGPFVGVFLDRWSRRQVLVVANLVRAGLVLALAATVAARLSDALLFALVVTALSLNRFLLAALSAALPHVVRQDELVLANAVTPTSGTLAFLLGLGSGSLLRTGVESLDGPGNVVTLLVAAVLLVIAAALPKRMPRDLLGPDFDPNAPAVRQAVGHVVTGLVSGGRHLAEKRPAAAGLAAIGMHRFFYGLSTVATILLYRNYFNDPANPESGLAGLSVAVLVSGAGFMAAAFITPWAVAAWGKRAWIIALLALAAFVEVMPGVFYTVPSLLVAAFALGVCSQGVKICVDTLVQEWVDDAFRGRIFALYDVVFNAAFVAAAAVGAVLLPSSGKSYPVLAFIALGYAATALGYARLSPGSPTRTAAPRVPAPGPAAHAPSAARAGDGTRHRPADPPARPEWP